MAKKHRRFGRLHQTLKDTNYSATGGTAGEYLKYLQGTNKLVVARKPDAKYLIRFNVGVIPFDIDYDSTANAINAYQGTMTIQADNIRSTFNANIPDTLFGIQRDLTQTKELPNFYPALAHVTVVSTSQTTKTAKTSGITKRGYKAYNTRTGSIPYGRSITGVVDAKGAAITDITKVTEEDCRVAILLAAKGKTAGSYRCTGISFTPEIHPEEGFFGETKPNGAATDIPAN